MKTVELLNGKYPHVTFYYLCTCDPMQLNSSGAVLYSLLSCIANYHNFL